ncbi:hypothetical protein OROGR_018571 [Orobanche gracilis]
MLPPGRGSSGDIVFNFYSRAEERQLSFGGGFPLGCRTIMSFVPKVEERDSVYPKCWRPNLSDVEVWNLSDPECPRIERRHSLTELPGLVQNSSGVSERRYLVYSEELDQLYLVRRHMIERVQVRGRNTGKFVIDIYFDNRGGWDNSYPYKTVRFDIHRIDDKDGKLLVDEKVSLDNVAIFIGINHGLVMEAAADQYQLNTNSIYFTDDTIHTPPNVRDADEHDFSWHLFVGHKWDSKWAYSPSVYGGHDIGIFDNKVLVVTNKEIAKGSNGTIVLEGNYEGRSVAVKRLVRTHHDVAVKAIQNLIASDQHPNIVPWHVVKYDQDFVYLCLERCTCSLFGLITFCTSSTRVTTIQEPPSIIRSDMQLLSNLESNDELELWRANDYPSALLLKLMRDIVCGLALLHELGIIHRDLKPQNVLIIEDRLISAKYPIWVSLSAST